MSISKETLNITSNTPPDPLERSPCIKHVVLPDAEYAHTRKQTRRERLMIEMDRVVPWSALIEPHHKRGDGWCSAYPLASMLRAYLMQAIKEALYGVTALPDHS